MVCDGCNPFNECMLKRRAMTRRSPSIITEFIVMIIAIGLVAGGLEAYLRVTATQKSKLYEGIETVPEIADTYFQHVFLEKHATKDAWNNANYDPQLGWDYQIAASRIRGPRKTGPKPAGMFRVITVGDSFTWGIEVKDDECFPHYLEKILQGQRAAEVFNMGVGSYGIDQMLLKYLRHGRQLRPDVVVLGIYPHDYDRTRLSFYSYSKPIFRRDGKDRAVRPRECARAAAQGGLCVPEEFPQRQRELCLGILEEPGAKAPLDPPGEQRLLRRDRPSRGIPARAPEGRAGQDRHETPRRPHPPGAGLRERRGALAREKRAPDRAPQGPLCEKLKIPFVDLLEALPQGRPLATIYKEHYIHRPDGSIGHFTPQGNAEVAKIIAEALKEKGMLKGGS